MTPTERTMFREAEARIAECKRVQGRKLDLSGLGLTELPESIRELTWLEVLHLRSNHLETLPDAVGKLINLKELLLYENPIKSLPASFSTLPNLEQLYFGSTDATQLADLLTSFPKLTAVGLINMGLKEVPTALRLLKNLKFLALSLNRLTGLPDWIGELENLDNLVVADNRLDRLPASLRNLRHLKFIALAGNTKLGLPVSILGGASAVKILDYYFRTRASSAPQPLNEFKLILVGRGLVGKTTLVHKLKTDKFKRFKRTPGIKITEMPVTIADEKMQAHVWDFGGQEIMHGTHRFFMTERALYLVLVSGREGTEDHDAEYWLSLVRSFAGDAAPVIVLRHKWDDMHFELNTQLLRDKFGQNLVFLETDSESGHGIKELRAEISKQAGAMPGLKASWPGEWRRVKDELPQAKKDYLTFDGFRAFCAERGVEKTEDQDALAGYLHELGLMLAYRKDEALRGFGVLNPQWVTQGIYTMLNARGLKEAGGRFTVEDFATVLSAKVYPAELHPYLLALMRKFRLCHPLDDSGCKHLIPELLTKEEPKLDNEFPPAECLGFLYRYESILPEGLMSRFIVETYVHCEEKHVWRTGLVLKRDHCRALVRADTQGRRVAIWVNGPAAGRRVLLGIIREHFERLHASYAKLRVNELVPLPGYWRSSVPYAKLLVYERANETECKEVVWKQTSTDPDGRPVGIEMLAKFSVKQLLDGVDVPGAPRYAPSMEREELMSLFGNELSLFISYSHRDELFRDELRAALTPYERTKELELWQDTMIVPGQKWEAEILRKLEEADLVVMLLSNDFIQSDYCMVQEYEVARRRDAAGECAIVPIVVRKCRFDKLELGKLQAILLDGKPIKNHRDRDTAWHEVTKQLDRVIKEFKARHPKRFGPGFPLPGI